MGRLVATRPGATEAVTHSFPPPRPGTPGRGGGMADNLAACLEPPAEQPAVFRLAHRLEPDAVAGAEGEVTRGDVHEPERRAADEVPAPGPLFRVDARLPPGEAHAPRLYAEARRV